MELFGVEELANSKSISAPGWAYVPDTGANASVAALQPASRKRAARNQPTVSTHETNVKQDAKILRDLAALDKESHRDVSIPVPIRHRNDTERVSHGKVTPGVRKILQSQKTFANHLSDAEALAALAPSAPAHLTPHTTSTAPATPAGRSSNIMDTSQQVSSSKRSHKKKDGTQSLRQTSRATPLRNVATPGHDAGAASEDGTLRGVKREHSIFLAGEDMSDSMASVTLAPYGKVYNPHPADDDPLLKSRLPSIPTLEELEALVSAPPLTYVAARAPLTDKELRKARRSFCEICGYWGRLKCLKCGTRVCALECLRTHQEDCQYSKYGA